MADIPESPEHAAWRKEFESVPEIKIRLLAEPNPALVSPTPKSVFAKAWLAEQAEAKRDSREEDTLSIAKEALAIAKEANRIAFEDLEEARSSAASAFEQARWAKWAAIIAVAVAAAAAIGQILAFIFDHS